MTQPHYYIIANPEEAARKVADKLKIHLARGERVLWLVGGGSAITVAVNVAEHLAQSDLSRLTVSLTDERFGPVGHVDSNWGQLEKAGFALPRACKVPVLQGLDLAATADAWASRLKQELEHADYSLGLFGIGADGHTAGILPHSPAVNGQGLVCGYDGGTYIRVTITPPAIAQLDCAIVYAMGAEKWSVLARLAEVGPEGAQPVQALKRAGELFVLSDYQKGTTP